MGNYPPMKEIQNKEYDHTWNGEEGYIFGVL